MIFMRSRWAAIYALVLIWAMLSCLPIWTVFPVVQISFGLENAIGRRGPLWEAIGALFAQVDLNGVSGDILLMNIENILILIFLFLASFCYLTIYYSGRSTRSVG